MYILRMGGILVHILRMVLLYVLRMGVESVTFQFRSTVEESSRVKYIISNLFQDANQILCFAV